jgi:hypothetical protein
MRIRAKIMYLHSIRRTILRGVGEYVARVVTDHLALMNKVASNNVFERTIRTFMERTPKADMKSIQSHIKAVNPSLYERLQEAKATLTE